MEKIYYYSPVLINLFKSIPEDVRNALREGVDWGEEKFHNQEYWPERPKIFGTKKGSVIISGIRPKITIDYRYGDGKIIVQSEEELLYIPRNKKELLITLGDSLAKDGIQGKNTPKIIAELLDELLLEKNSEEKIENIEKLIFENDGVAIQNTAWKRTKETLGLAYKKMLEGRVEAASEKISYKTNMEINKEEIYEAFYEKYLQNDIEEFLAWGKERGINTEDLKAEFMNLPYLVEDELWFKFNIFKPKINLKFTEGYPDYK